MQEYKNSAVALTIQVSPDETLIIKGKVARPSDYTEMTLFAAAPIDRMTNYSGSGLPFPCSDIAFESTPNTYTIPTTGIVDTTFKRPNSYYTALQEKIPPTVFVKLVKKSGEPNFVKFSLEDQLPLRTLFYRQEGHDPAFYQRRADILGVQYQESILRNLESVKVQGRTG